MLSLEEYAFLKGSTSETFMKFQSEPWNIFPSLKYKNLRKKASILWKAKKALKSIPLNCDSCSNSLNECWGCKENLANPQGHMSYGGCLYIPDEFDFLYPPLPSSPQ
jgi:hypothetical protein